jgi:cytochrome P450 family 628
VRSNFQLYNEVERLHKEYKSDIVRTGPRELSVATADAVPLVHGPNSKCTKGPWYNASKFLDGGSTHQERDKQKHREFRKGWDKAFSAKSLREYEPRVNRITQFLIERLKEQVDHPSVRISNWMNFYGFDVMGDVGFSRSFGMLERGEEDDIIKLLHASMEPASTFGHINWATTLALRSGLGVKDMLKHMQWTADALKERKKVQLPLDIAESELMHQNRYHPRRATYSAGSWTRKTKTFLCDSTLILDCWSLRVATRPLRP